MKIDTVFQILAATLVVAGLYFFWTGNKDGAFVAVVVGCASFFLSIRFQAKARNRAREAEREDAEAADETAARGE